MNIPCLNSIYTDTENILFNWVKLPVHVRKCKNCDDYLLIFSLTHTHTHHPPHNIPETSSSFSVRKEIRKNNNNNNNNKNKQLGKMIFFCFYWTPTSSLTECVVVFMWRGSDSVECGEEKQHTQIIISSNNKYCT